MAALIGTGVFAVPASAHNSDWSVTCDSVSVHLAAYNGRVTNTVTISVDGGAVLASDANFGSSYDFSGALPDHASAIKVHLVVSAGDGNQYNRDEFKTSEPCEKPPTTPPTTVPVTTPPTTTATTAPPTTTPPTTATTAPPTTAATSSAAAVAATSSAAGGGDLAETGSSSSTPLIAGIAAVAVAGGAGLLFVSRKRRNSAHR